MTVRVQTTDSLLTRRLPLVIVAGVMLLQTVTHLAWLSISAHSGQVAIPWMLNRGRGLFTDLIEQHAPGSTLIAAVAQRLLPLDPVVTARLLNLLLVLALTVLVYLLARRLAGEWSGVAAVLVWFWWEPVYGNVLFYFDTLLGFFVMLAALVWVTQRHRSPLRTAFICGLLLGAATIMKQHGWAAVVIFALWLLAQQRRTLPLFVAGAVILPLLLVVALALDGGLDSYLYWNWGFNLSGLMVNPPLTGDFLRKVLLTAALAPAFVLLALRDWSHNRDLLLVGLLWLATVATIYPRPGEIHVMGMLPLLAVMSGVVIAQVVRTQTGETPGEFADDNGFAVGKPLRRFSFNLLQMTASQLTLAGVVIGLALGWAWTGAVAYVPGPLGRAATPAHDEFAPVVNLLNATSQPGDTLFVLPQTDSTPQIHPMSDLLPPGMWVKGWFWYLQPPGVVERLLGEWASSPPTYIVYFPDLIDEGIPGIEPLVAFMDTHYEPVGSVGDIPFHGEAVVYRLRLDVA